MHTGNESTSEFDAFVAEGEVEVGAAPAAVEPEKPAKPAKPAEADDADDQTPAEDADAEDADEDADQDDEEAEKAKKRKPSERIRELTRRVRDRDRLIDAMAVRLENLEKGLTPQLERGSPYAGNPAPDLSDAAKYPLGHLDDRYIEDKLEWLAETKAAERADAALQRQQESEQDQALERQQTELLAKVDDLSTRGADLYDDFQDVVVDAGLRGDWALSQATFEAAHESDHGAQILYELSKDKKEAARVAALPPYQQLKFVQGREAEIGKGKEPRRIPRAGDPPKNVPRGSNSRTSINPATDNLDDFERAWAQDAKKN